MLTLDGKTKNRIKTLSLPTENTKRMDIQAEKYSLIEYITKVKDVSLIEKLKEFVKANERDFWSDLTEAQQKEIRQGMKELDQGEKSEYESIMAKHR
ncbi:MAG: hypothetical protein OEX22_11770 [Cyclobacteriaceae bacterium]|nr:hypothetical protein [Cyclobacteriaceae bacterium]